MKFNLKYLILPLSIISCINTYNVNAMDDTDENKNEIIEHNNGNNTSQIQNQSNNDLLNVNINNENDIEKIKQLVTEKITDIPTVKFLIENTSLNNGNLLDVRKDSIHIEDGKSLYSSHNYYKYQILNLLKSFNSLELNKTFTVDQLIRINDIVKTINFFVQKDKEYKRQGLYHDYDFDFAISDHVFGIGLSHNNENNLFSKCIFIQPSGDYLFAIKKNYKKIEQYKGRKKDEITNKSFRNLLDVVKLCSNKKLPITFEDKNGIQYNNPYLVTKDEYKTLLTTLMKDFWISFYGEYENDVLHGISGIKVLIRSEEEYEKLKNECNTLKNKVNKLYNEWCELLIDKSHKYDEVIKTKQYENYDETKQELYKKINPLAYFELKFIVNAFENNYDEKKFIEIFGEETINNIRYIINHLIDFEINSNYKLFEDTLNKILSKEQKLYETMRRSRNRGEKLIDKCVQELEKVFNLNQKVWKDNIIWQEGKDIFKQLEDESEIELSDDSFSFDNDNKNCDDDVFLYEIVSKQYKLHSKERVEDYLKKLLYDKVLDTYLRTKVFKYIMGSNYLRRNMKDDHVLLKTRKEYLSNIESKHVFSDILKYITLSEQKDLFFGQKKKEEKDSNSKNNENIILNDNYNNNSEKFEESNNKSNLILNKKRKRIFDVNNSEINNNYNNDFE